MGASHEIVSRRAYALWEKAGRSHGCDVAQWLQAERDLKNPLRVTFDSNTYRKVTDPNVFPNDPQHSDLVKVNQAIRDGLLKGYLSETIATLEGIQNAVRGQYFASHGNASSLMLHPGLHNIVERWLNNAISLGFEFLRTPRIGVQRPAFLNSAPFKADASSVEQGQRHDLQSTISRYFESAGVGFEAPKSIGERIKARNNGSGPWFNFVNQTLNVQEHKEFQKSVSEWADGDTIAAHVGYKNDMICTSDKAVGAGKSVFDQTNRAFMETNYGVIFVSIGELADIF